MNLARCRLCFSSFLMIFLILASFSTGMAGEAGRPEGGTSEGMETDMNQPERMQKHIVILGTSDMHGNILGYQYEDRRETTNDGMARLYTYIRQVREETPDVFLVDAGDEIQGTIMTDDICQKEPDEPHPVMAAMNFMGYDAMTLGNHEFNWGIPVMRKILSQADFPVLGANILDASGNYLTGKGWTIIERGGVRLAVIGVCTPDIPIWDKGKEGIDELTYESASDGVARALREIGDRADIIMVSAHMGMFPEYDEDGGADSARKILEDHPEVDVLQVGHLHITVNEKLGNVPVGGVRNNGREICRFDLYLDEKNQITDSRVSIIGMDGVRPDQELSSLPLVQEAHERTISYIFGGGSGDKEKGKVIGFSTARFQPENEIRQIPQGLIADTPVLDLINQIQMEESGADVSAASLFREDSDLPAGEITFTDIFQIYKYDNILYRVKVTGAELKAYMEWSASFYNQWKEGDINISFDPDFPYYQYDMFAGVEYEIDISKPAGQRIRNVMFCGEPLMDGQELTLAVNNYRYSSALKMFGLINGKREWESSRPIREMIVDYFEHQSPVTPKTDENWKITGIDLNEGDPERTELIRRINDGELPVPVSLSYNLKERNWESGTAAQAH